MGDVLGSPIPDLQHELASLPVRRGGLGLRNPTAVLGPAFQASNLTFANAHEDLPDIFWLELRNAWVAIQKHAGLREDVLPTPGPIDPEDIDPSWVKQKWWQAQADQVVENKFKVRAPLRLRAPQPNCIPCFHHYIPDPSLRLKTVLQSYKLYWLFA